MKWFKLAPVLALAVALLGCGKNSKDTAATNAADDAMRTAQQAQNKNENANGTEDENTYDPKGDREKKEKELFESENSKTRNAALEEASDYISLVELSADASGKVSLKFIKNYKGALSTVEIPTPKGMSPNQEYIIFYRDTEDGTIRPTHDTYGFYKVDGSDDSLLRYFEQRYDDSVTAKDNKDDDSKEDKDTASAGSSSKSSTSNKKSSSSKSDSSSSNSSKSNRSSKSSTSSTKSSNKSDSKQSSKKSTNLEN